LRVSDPEARLTGWTRPRLAPHGYATIYLNLPPGKFKDEYRHVTSVLAKRSPEAPDQRDGIMSESPEVLYLLGQARFAARVQADDYRYVLTRAYPGRKSHALVSNAVFSIPYVIEALDTPVHDTRDAGLIRFLTHLRVRRTVYAVDPVQAESLIIERLQSLIKKCLNSEASIEAGLGWADFLISGVVPAKRFNEFLTLLVEFNRVCIDPAIGRADCVFKRSLTLLGYEWTGKHQPPAIEQKLKALMFIRAKPGHLSKVERLISDTFDHTDVEFVDGKIDVIASMRSEKRPNFFAQHEKLSEETGPDSIEKFETHVVFGHELFRDDKAARLDTSDPGDCGCAERVQHPRYEVDALPPTLANAVKNLEFLFSSTMRDPANCCDARTAILACEESLKRLLRTEMLSKIEMNTASEDMQSGRATSDDVLHAADTVVENLYRVDRWVRTSERILRQRTVGSFEEFLGQSDRAVSYRGGAQKVLSVADNLMNDLYARLQGLVEPEPIFTSLYDSVDRIQHVVGTAIVKMPVRALFFLPSVVPDLWHEVGGFHFFRTIPASALGLDMTQAMQQVLYYDLADHYGDLVSFLYGFKLDHEQFATALIEAWLASQRYVKVPEAARQPSYVHLLARIVAVAEFLLGHTAPAHAAMNRKVVLTVLYEDTCEITSRYNSSELPAGPTTVTCEAVLAILESPDLDRCLGLVRARLNEQDIADAVKALEIPPDDQQLNFDEPADLRSFTIDHDLNDEFRALYWAVMQERRKTGVRARAFAFTAALTRGAALEYHRRVATRST
jgi:hypothetical protein